MLLVAPATEMDPLSESLAGLLAMVHPKAGMGSPDVILEAARRSASRILRQLRHHLHENTLLFWALEKAEPACIASVRRIASVHGELRRLSHELCKRLRQRDVPGARGVARTFLSLSLEHASQERSLLNHIFRTLDIASTCRFADALLERMLSELAMRPDVPCSNQSVVDLHSHYVLLIRHLQGRTEGDDSFEVEYENPCRR